MSKELQGKTKKDLRDMAKDLNIVGRWDMTKQELIEAILGAESSDESIAENESAKVNVEIDNQAGVEVEEKSEKESINIIPNLEEKKSYVDNAKIGTLVAFRLESGKVKSAKVIKKSTAKQRFMLETIYGAQFIVPYDKVLWVRTGKRWPRGIYNLLKGGEVVDEQKSV